MGCYRSPFISKLEVDFVASHTWLRFDGIAFGELAVWQERACEGIWLHLLPAPLDDSESDH